MVQTLKIINHHTVVLFVLRVALLEATQLQPMIVADTWTCWTFLKKTLGPTGPS